MGFVSMGEERGVEKGRGEIDGHKPGPPRYQSRPERMVLEGIDGWNG